MGLIDSRSERNKRFPQSQQSERKNLYTTIVELVVSKRYGEAEQVVEEHLSRDPCSGEAIVCWTELKLCQGDLNSVIERVFPLRAASPTNPYYMLASTLFVIAGSEVESLDYPGACDGSAGELECWAYGSSDAFAKLAFASIIRGMWQSGMHYLIEAMRVKEEYRTEPADLILLKEMNVCSLDNYLYSVRALEGRRLYKESVNDVSLKLIVQTLCILLIAYEDLGICEAWPVALQIANDRTEVVTAWNDLTSLFSRFCPDWIQIQTVDGGEPLVRVRIEGLVASHIKKARFGQSRSTYFQTTVFRSGAGLDNS